MGVKAGKFRYYIAKVLHAGYQQIPQLCLLQDGLGNTRVIFNDQQSVHTIILL